MTRMGQGGESLLRVKSRQVKEESQTPPARKLQLAYFVSHPIQYQAPLLRQIAAQPDIDLTVYFTSDFSARGYLDEGFGVNVQWDIPLLDGYRYEVLPPGLFRTAHHDRQISAGIYQRLRRQKFDIVWVHGYSSFNSMQTILASRLLRIPVLLRSDSNLYDRPRSPLKLKLKDGFFQVLRLGVSGALACGKANRQYWRHHLGQDIPVFDMPYAVDNTFFRHQACQAARHREELRSELGLESGRPIFLFASKLQKRKRCLDLIEAFLRAGDSSAVRRSYLLIAGDGEERLEIERRVAGNTNIRMLGFRNQQELPRFFDLCDAFVLPSIHEPWGLVVNEVMNAARAVIVSDQVGCQPDLVHPGVNGYVFKALDIESLASALREAISSPENLVRMGQQSLRIIDSYSFEHDLAGLRQALYRLAPAASEPPGNAATQQAGFSA